MFRYVTMSILNWYKKYKRKNRIESIRYKNEQLKRKAEDLFNVCEYKGYLWLTYERKLVCPISMFDTGDPVAIVLFIRNTYIENHKEDRL